MDLGTPLRGVQVLESSLEERSLLWNAETEAGVIYYLLGMDCSYNPYAFASSMKVVPADARMTDKPKQVMVNHDCSSNIYQLRRQHSSSLAPASFYRLHTPQGGTEVHVVVPY